MPGELTDKGADIALDAAFGRATQTARTMYLALLTAAAADTATIASMTEYAATGYARQTAAFSAPAANSGARRIANSGALTFGPLTGANGSTVVTDAALVSASSGTTGDLVASWTLTASRTPAAGDSITVAAAALSMDLD